MTQEEAEQLDKIQRMVDSWSTKQKNKYLRDMEKKTFLNLSEALIWSMLLMKFTALEAHRAVLESLAYGGVHATEEVDGQRVTIPPEVFSAALGRRH